MEVELPLIAPLSLRPVEPSKSPLEIRLLYSSKGGAGMRVSDYVSIGQPVGERRNTKDGV